MNTPIKKDRTRVGTPENEKRYIEEYMLCFIDSKKKPIRKHLGCRWYVLRDLETEIRYLLLEYILEHFTLYELYTIFYCQGSSVFSSENYTTEKALLYKLVHKFVNESHLFWDEEKEEIVLPQIL
jgi:hypothetical protein